MNAINWYYSLLITHLMYMRLSTACFDGDDCPPDKPFCTQAGCVFSCEQPFHINGSNCVSDCGSLFVDTVQNQCVSSCPEGLFVNSIVKPNCVAHCPDPYFTNGTECVDSCGNMYVDDKKCVAQCPNFVRESLKLINNQAYIQRECDYACYQSDYIVNNTCVKTCPTELSFVSKETRTCLQNCSAGEPYMSNFTAYGIDYRWCLRDCNGEVSENGFCVDKCSPGKVIYQSTCVEKCPATHPLMNSEKQCFVECAGDIALTNATCACPANRTFFSEGRCKAECDSKYTFIRSIGLVNVCAEDCSTDEYLLNGTYCVKNCPEGTVVANGHCLDTCPPSRSFKCNTLSSEKGCSKIPSSNNEFKVFQTMCVEQCPLPMFAHNKTCVGSCPYFAINSNRTCVDTCPSEAGLIANLTLTSNCDKDWYGPVVCDYLNTDVHQCVASCPPPMLKINQSCAKFCPDGFYFLNHSCIQACPDTMLVAKKIFVYETWTRVYDMYSADRNRMMKSNQSFDGKQCVSKCSVNEHLYINKSCLLECPSDHKYSHNGVCTNQPCKTKFVYNFTTWFRCVDVCNTKDVIYNATCFKQCPFVTMVVDNGTCVSDCPPERSLITRQPLTKECHGDHGMCTRRSVCSSTCGEDLYLQNGVCVQGCESSYVMFPVNKTCLSNCPTSHSYKQPNPIRTVNVECVSHCLNPEYQLDLMTSTCVKKCPVDRKYVMNNECREACPTHTVFNAQDYGIKCESLCPDGQFLHNMTCVKSCPDVAQYQLQGKLCVQACPSTATLHYQPPYKDIKACIRSCDDFGKSDYVFVDGDCKSDCRNNSLAVLHGQCMFECPTGYRWMYGLCAKLITLIVLVSVLALFTLLVAVCSRTCIKEYLQLLATVYFRRDQVPVLDSDQEDDCTWRDGTSIGEVGLDEEVPLVSIHQDDLIEVDDEHRGDIDDVPLITVHR